MSCVKRHVNEFIEYLELLNQKATMKSVEEHLRLPLILLFYIIMSCEEEVGSYGQSCI